MESTDRSHRLLCRRKTVHGCVFNCSLESFSRTYPAAFSKSIVNVVSVPSRATSSYLDSECDSSHYDLALQIFCFSRESISQLQTVTFVKRTSGGGGDLPPPPEPPAIEGQGLSVPAPPNDLKVLQSYMSSMMYLEKRLCIVSLNGNSTRQFKNDVGLISPHKESKMKIQVRVSSGSHYSFSTYFQTLGGNHVPHTLSLLFCSGSPLHGTTLL